MWQSKWQVNPSITTPAFPGSSVKIHRLMLGRLPFFLMLFFFLRFCINSVVSRIGKELLRKITIRDFHPAKFRQGLRKEWGLLGQAPGSVQNRKRTLDSDKPGFKPQLHLYSLQDFGRVIKSRLDNSPSHETPLQRLRKRLSPSGLLSSPPSSAPWDRTDQGNWGLGTQQPGVQR